MAHGASREAPLVSFVLPVLNEEASLASLHEQISGVMRGQPYDHEMIFVDDGSTDASFSVLSEIQKRDPRVRVIRLRRNFGKAAGYSAGFDDARGEIVLTLDTDLQDDPAEIPAFIEKLGEGYDMVVGWKHEGKGSLEKSVASKLFNTVVRLLTGVPLHDFNCPFKAYRKQVLEEIQVYGDLHRYIPVLAAARGFSLTEIKIRNLPRRHGKSHYGVQRYLGGMLDLLTVIFITRFAKRPLHLLARGGIAVAALGFGILVFLTVAHFLYVGGVLGDPSWNIHDRPALSLGVLLMIVGFQFVSIGLVGELFVIGSGSRQPQKGYSIKERRGD